MRKSAHAEAVTSRPSRADEADPVSHWVAEQREGNTAGNLRRRHDDRASEPLDPRERGAEIGNLHVEGDEVGLARRCLPDAAADSGLARAGADPLVSMNS